MTVSQRFGQLKSFKLKVRMVGEGGGLVVLTLTDSNLSLWSSVVYYCLPYIACAGVT